MRFASQSTPSRCHTSQKGNRTIWHKFGRSRPLRRHGLDSRYQQEATVMPNKAFLVALGMAVSPGLASSETLWTTIGNMATPRSGHSATLLPSGTVLVAGGDGAL